MTSLASVFVEVRPDTSGFSAELKTSLAKTREAVDVAAKLDTSKIKPQLDTLKAELKAITVTKANIYADTSAATAKLRSLKLELKGLSEKVKIDATDVGVKERVAVVKAEIASISGAKAKLSVDSSAASAHIKALSAQLALFDRDRTVKVKVDQQGVNFAFRGISMLSTALVGLAPIAVPALAAVTAGVGLLGSALGSAGGAGIALAGVIIGDVAGYKKLQQVIKTQKAALDSSTTAVSLARVSLAGTTKGTASYHSALGRLNTALADQKAKQDALSGSQNKVTTQFGPLDRGIQKVKGSFAQLQRATNPAVMGLMGNTLGVVAGILPRLAPLVNGTARAVSGLVSDFGRFTKTAKFDGILNFFTKYGPSAVTSFGHIIANLVMGVGGLIGAFAPFQQHFLGSLETMTRKFAAWSAGFGKSGGFQRFMAYTQKVLPDVRDLFVNLTQFVGKFVVALGPLAGIELKGLTGLLRGLNALPPKALTAIAWGITGIVLGLKAWELGTKAVVIVQRIAAASSKAWAAAQWLLNVALTANPIGLVVVAIGALVIGFIIAYKKSATFRAIVSGALNAVKNVAQAVVGWFSSKFVPFFTKTIPNAFHATVAWVKQHWPVILVVLTGPIGLATVFISKHWDKITGAFKAARNWAATTFKRAWAYVRGWITDPVDSARKLLGKILNKISDSFSSGVRGIKRIWSGLKEAAAAPVRFIINTVYNDGIRVALNKIPGVHLGSAHASFAKGGVLPGYTPGRDVHHFTSPTAGDLHLAGGEAIMVPEWTKAHGGPRAVAAMNQAAKRGALHPPAGAEEFRALRFAKGGIFRPTAGGSYGSVHDQYTGFPAVDVRVGSGTPVHAASSGRVSISRDLRGNQANGYRSYGRYIVLDHGFGLGKTLYAHLASRGVGAGARVGGGQRIAFSDNTGNSTGPHLHFGATHGPGMFMRGSTNYGGKGAASGGGSGPGVTGINPGHWINTYAGPSAKDVKAGIHPGAWAAALRRMGPLAGQMAGGIPGLAGKAVSWATTKISALFKASRKFVGAVAGAVTGFAGAGPKSGGVRGKVHSAASGYPGWGQGAQWAALSNIVSHESGWNPRAQNPTSTAYGLFQFLNGTWAGTGIKKTSDPFRQSVAGMRYIRSRYGSPIGAWNFWQKHHSYDGGGIARGMGSMQKKTLAPERVLSPRQTESFERLVALLERNGKGERVEMVITNWETGKGYIRNVADDRVAAASEFAGTRRRMG